MINFLNLEYFLVAAEELNFTKAAKRLYISQQSLSNHISNLEKEFDIALFHRTTPLTLTYAGQVLEKRAREILDCGKRPIMRSLYQGFFQRQADHRYVTHRGRKILPEILPLYKEQFPNIDLQLIEGNSSELDAGLLHGEIDLIIGMLPFKVENIETYIITADPENKKLVLSAKELLKERRDAEVKEKMGAFKAGQVVEGTVESLKDYGAFVELTDGVTGLHHISQISNQRIKHPGVCPEGRTGR